MNSFGQGDFRVRFESCIGADLKRQATKVSSRREERGSDGGGVGNGSNSYGRLAARIFRWP